jgi:hypothetical protein
MTLSKPKPASGDLVIAIDDRISSFKISLSSKDRG